MENPTTWGKAEKVVNKVLEEHYANEQLPIHERRIGWSLPKRITVALREAGLLTE